VRDRQRPRIDAIQQQATGRRLQRAGQRVQQRGFALLMEMPS
jgi:hypothetical protein